MNSHILYLNLELRQRKKERAMRFRGEIKKNVMKTLIVK